MEREKKILVLCKGATESQPALVKPNAVFDAMPYNLCTCLCTLIFIKHLSGPQCVQPCNQNFFCQRLILS